jgi:hypothetical protein
MLCNCDALCILNWLMRFSAVISWIQPDNARLSILYPISIDLASHTCISHGIMLLHISGAKRCDGRASDRLSHRPKLTAQSTAELTAELTRYRFRAPHKNRHHRARREKKLRNRFHIHVSGLSASLSALVYSFPQVSIVQ